MFSLYVITLPDLADSADQVSGVSYEERGEIIGTVDYKKSEM